MNTTYVAAAATEVRRNFEVSLLPAFDEIAETYLKAFRRLGYATLQRYLDSKIAIGGVYYRRRAGSFGRPRYEGGCRSRRVFKNGRTQN